MSFLRSLSVVEGLMLVLIIAALLVIGVVLSQRGSQAEEEDRFATNTPIINWAEVTPLVLTAEPTPAD